MVAHVSDFGLARLVSTVTDSSQNQTSTIGIKGSIGYVAPEYGMGGEVSTKGDVYSFGVFLMEMFLGKRPTDEMFEDDLNLHNFVKMALPKRLVQIVDPTLLIREVKEIPAATVATREYNNENEIEADEANQERMNMEEVSKELHSIKNAFLGSRI
nr:putative lrr receptor-like serine/threonine-protein kinase [Quercus suber]